MTESTTETLYCYVHPNRETSLRCNNCNRPICAACAVRTPTGYRCRECVKGQQKVFNTSEWYDYISGFIVAALLSAVAAFLVTLIGGIGFFGWFLIAAGAPTAAVVIAEGVRMATRRRRSRTLFVTVAAGVVLGALPVILFQVLSMNLFGIVFQVIYLLIAVPVVYSRLSGIQLFR
jgi:small-conductance mechanosensitive channel